MRPSSPPPQADAKVSGLRRRLHHVGRALRVLALRLVSPVDRLVLIVNGKHRYPPIYLRRQAGPLHTFERVAGEYAGYLATLAGLTSSSLDSLLHGLRSSLVLYVKDVSTTMLYTHVPNKGGRGVKSPLDEISGIRCYRSLAEIAGDIDLLVIAVPAARISAESSSAVA